MPGKYRNVRVTYDGIKFDSKGEGGRYLVLKARQAAGQITGLETQASYKLNVNGVPVCTYRADFRYRMAGALVVEDFKSPATAKDRVFRLKFKLMKACHGVTVKVVLKPDAP